MISLPITLPEMPLWILILVLFIFSLCDCYLTYIWMGKRQMVYKGINYEKAELNRIQIFFWNKFGLKVGSLLGILILPITLIPALWLFSYIINGQQLFYVMFGVDIIVLNISIREIIDLNKEILKGNTYKFVLESNSAQNGVKK